MKDMPLSREEVRRVIEGKGAARRVPMAIQLWVSPEKFGERTEEYRKLLDSYPCDIQQVDLQISVNYCIDQSTAQELYRTVGAFYYDNVMYPRILENTKAVPMKKAEEKAAE